MYISVVNFYKCTCFMVNIYFETDKNYRIYFIKQFP